jgi:PKD repeat protein
VLTAHCIVSATLNGSPVASASITSVTWDFGDGITMTTSGAAANNTDHTYSGPGPDTIIVTDVTVTGTPQKGTGSTTLTIS